MNVEGTKRSFEQKHMVNWIVDSVVKGITPDQVDNTFNKSFLEIDDYKSIDKECNILHVIIQHVSFHHFCNGCQSKLCQFMFSRRCILAQLL